MIKQIAKTISLFILATQGGNAASETTLPKLAVSPHCKDYFKTEPERALALLCLSDKLGGLKKATDESRRRFDETEPQVNTEFERGLREDSQNFLDSTDQLSIFIQKQCVPFRKKVPEDCQGEFSQMIIDANANAKASSHSGL
jgi:hypothetical protein